MKKFFSIVKKKKIIPDNNNFIRIFRIFRILAD